MYLFVRTKKISHDARGLPTISQATWEAHVRELRSLTLALVLGIGTFGCATDGDEPMGWDEFQSNAAHDPSTGVYVYDGDQTALDLDDLEQAYFAYLAGFDDDGLATSTQPLIVNIANGQWDKWADP